MTIDELDWGVKLITIEPFRDDRGIFYSLCPQELLQTLNFNVAEMNESRSRSGVIRGLHSQTPPQAKLVRCTAGSIMDVIVNAEEKKYLAITLTVPNQWVYVPANLYHGFQSIAAQEAVVQYLVTQPYNPNAQKVIRYNSPALNIPWIELISDKDKNGDLLI